MARRAPRERRRLQAFGCGGHGGEGGVKPGWGRLLLPVGLYAGKRMLRRDAPAGADEAGSEAGRAAAARRQGGAGVEADSPLEIPARGWWQIAKRVFTQIGEDRVLAEAASVTYYTLLAIFPAIAALISLYGLVADPKTIGATLNGMSGVVPAGGMQIIGDQVRSLTSAPSKALGFGAVIGLLTSIWSANAAVKSLFDALNAVNEERESRSFLHLTWLSLAFTGGSLLFVILAMTAVVVVPAVMNFVGFGAAGTILLSLLRWPLLLAAFLGFIALVYRYGPCRARAKWRWITWGSAFAAVTWVAASIGFSWYVSNFGNYNKTYGSLGAAVGFMTWIWISTIIVLIGAELNAEMEHQTARDTTVGQEKPLGSRGARRADEVAAA